MIVRKSLEIYSDSSAVSEYLLVRFSATSDHGERYWGVLTNKKCYLFYNLYDAQALSFKRDCNKTIFMMVKNYCDGNKY
jgi:hypothetical protein